MVNISERNKKVALSRWNKVLSEEKRSVPDTIFSAKLKAAICGFLAGDGSVQIRKEKTFLHYDLCFFPDDDLMLKTYCNAIKLLYGKTPSVKTIDNVYNVRLTSRMVVEDLLNLAQFGIKKWNLPYSLFSIKGTREAWLRAFFSAEGYVGSNVIKVQTVNKQGMMEVSKLLTEFSIEHRMYEYVPNNPNYSPVTIIMILRKSAKQLFSEKIGFWHSKKTATLKKALDL